MSRGEPVTVRDHHRPKRARTGRSEVRNDLFRAQFSSCMDVSPDSRISKKSRESLRHLRLIPRKSTSGHGLFRGFPGPAPLSSPRSPDTVFRAPGKARQRLLPVLSTEGSERHPHPTGL